MEKVLKYLMIGILALLVIGFVTSYFFMNSNVKKIRQNMEQMEKNLQQSINAVDFSKQLIDSLQKTMIQFKGYVTDMKLQVDKLEQQRKVNDQKFKQQYDSINKKLHKLIGDVNALSDDIKDISIEDIHKH